MSDPDPLDLDSPEFGVLYDELPLWSAPFGLLLLDAVPMRPDARVLDVGAGTGFLTVELAQRLGPDAFVTAVDPWPAAAKRLRWKLAALGIDNAQVLEQDACDLQLEPASIDLIVSNLGVHNFERPARVLEVLFEAARPGADLLLTTNLAGHMSALYRILRSLVEKSKGDVEAVTRAEARRGTVESMQAQLEAAGFRVVESVEHSFRMRFSCGAALVRHHFIRLGFLDEWLGLLGGPANRARARLEAAVDRHIVAEGELSLTVPIALLHARRPG